MTEDNDASTLPVFLCGPGEQTADPQTHFIGRAADKKSAAKLIRQETGDPDYRASDVYYSARYNAYFAEEG